MAHLTEVIRHTGCEKFLISYDTMRVNQAVVLDLLALNLIEFSLNFVYDFT